MLINDSFPVKEKMKYDDMIFNQFDEDVDTDADGSELFSLINQSLEHFNQSVHSSGFDKDGRDSAYETIASSLSNDFFLDQPNNQQQFGNGYLLNVNSKKSYLNNTNFGKNRMIHLPNESSSYNEKIMKSTPGMNSLSNSSRVRLESSSSACDPLISCFINNNTNGSNNSPPQFFHGSPDFLQSDNFEQIRNIDQQQPQINTNAIKINNFDQQSTGYSRSLTAFSKSLSQTSDMFSKISLVDHKQRKPSGSQTSQLRSNSNFQLHSTNTFNQTNRNSYFYDVSPNTRIQSPPLSLYKSQQGSSTVNGACKKSSIGTLFSYNNNNNNKMINPQPQKYQSSSCCNQPQQQIGPMNGMNMMMNRLSKSNRACSFFLRGHCKKRDCEFAHDLRQVTCRFWEYGSCLKGSSCLFLHGYPEGMTNKSIL